MHHADASCSTEPSEDFFFHKVGKLDTLAGIAIRYNADLSDVKLANGLHSEFSLYARDVLKISKRKLPASVMQYRPKESSRHHHYRESASRPKCSTSIAMTELKKYYGLNANGIENGRLKGEDGGDVVRRPPENDVEKGKGESPSGTAATFKPSLSRDGVVETIMRKKEEKEALRRTSNESWIKDSFVDKSSIRQVNVSAKGELCTSKNLRDVSIVARKRSENTMSQNTSASSVMRKSVPQPKLQAQYPTGMGGASTGGKESFFEKIKRISNKPALANGPNSSGGVGIVDQIGEATLSGSQSSFTISSSNNASLSESQARQRMREKGRKKL